MFQVVTMWNLSRPDEIMKDSIEDIELRGYNPKEVSLPGEFALRLSMEEIRSLSVSNIADIKCATRRLLYLDKGINRPPTRSSRTTWGRVAGNIVEDHVRTTLGANLAQCSSYPSLIRYGEELNEEFMNSCRNTRQLERLREIEESELDGGSKMGDADWLLELLRCSGRAELGLGFLHSRIGEENSLNITDVEMGTEQRSLEINPDTEMGISSPATPDFIVPRFGIVGDIKTGVIKEGTNPFKNHFLPTCAGYALAYENQHKNGHNINWGMIYLIPTQVPSDYVRALTFAQLYIFAIDDSLRRWFLDKRNQAYDIISKSNPPKLPPENRRTPCKYCRFRDHCESEGLEL